MSKPVFRLDLHREMWTLIASGCVANKKDAYAVIAERYGIKRAVFAACFACEACNGLLSTTIEVGNPPVYLCRCPLYWGEGNNCVRDTRDIARGLPKPLFTQYCDAENGYAKQTIAADIAMLPLNDYAYEFFEVVGNE